MKHLTPCQAIKQFCLTCEESRKAVKDCQNPDCPLWPYRLGHNPNHQGIGRTLTPGQKAKSGRFLPSQDGEKKKLQLITDGRKRIPVIVEDVR